MILFKTSSQRPNDVSLRVRVRAVACLLLAKHALHNQFNVFNQHCCMSLGRILNLLVLQTQTFCLIHSLHRINDHIEDTILFTLIKNNDTCSMAAFKVATLSKLRGAQSEGTLHCFWLCSVTSYAQHVECQR